MNQNFKLLLLFRNLRSDQGPLNYYVARRQLVDNCMTNRYTHRLAVNCQYAVVEKTAQIAFITLTGYSWVYEPHWCRA